MLSRAANSIYWMARYIERAENIARFVNVNLHLMLDGPVESEEQWEPLVIISGDHDQFKERYGVPTKDNVINFLTFDRDNPNSILSTVLKARENARSVREIVSSEMWQQVNKFYFLLLDAEKSGVAFDTPYDFYNQVKLESHLFIGITDTTMSHNEAWHFDRLGRLLERADKTSRILDVKYFMLLPRVEDVGTPIDNIGWAALLNSASAFEMYRKTFRRITPTDVALFLIQDLEFPRSIRYCLVKAQGSLHEITGTDIGTFKSKAERQLGRLRSDIDYANIDEIVSVGLHEFLDGFQTKLFGVGESIFSTFFSLRTTKEMQNKEVSQ